MSGFGYGLLTGVISSAVVACGVEIWLRVWLYCGARKLRGRWIAHDMLDARTVDRSKPMKNSWATVMTPKRWWLSWLPDSHVLDIEGDHVSDDGTLRHHKGYLVIDRASPQLASRILCYSGSDEVSQQRIVISSGGDTLHVFPTLQPEPAIHYRRHALCRPSEDSR